MSSDLEFIEQQYDQAVPLDELTPHPANPNVGDLDLLDELLAANGFAGCVLAQKSTGVLIDGEHRWRSLRERGAKTIPVIWLDVDDDRRDRLLASMNEATRRGKNDEAKLIALLKPFEARPGGMAGTAFSVDQLAALVRHRASVTANPADPNSEWEGMPDFAQGDMTGAFATHVHFMTEDDADEFFRLLGRPRARVLWWPEHDGHKGDPLTHRVVAKGSQ